MTNAFVWFAAVLLPLWLALIGLTLWGTFSLWFTEPPSEDNQALAYRVHYLALVGLMTALAGLIGAPLAIHRLYTVERQTKAQEEGLITDRINKAVEGLGAERASSRVHRTISYSADGTDFVIDNWYDDGEAPNIPDDALEIEFSEWETITQTLPNLEVRIGAIYALERIAQDSLRDHIRIMEILCAYIRENAPVADLEPSEPPFDRAVPRSDIQAAISVIGRRTYKQKAIERSDRFRLDLRNTNLSGVDFTGGDLSAAQLHRCRLEGSFFRDCDLSGTQMFGSLLNFADFNNAKLYGTRFDHAAINRPHVTPGGMNRSILAGDIYGINIAAADLQSLNYLGNLETRNRMHGTIDTSLHHSIIFNSQEIEQLQNDIHIARADNRYDDAEVLQNQLNATGFASWSPFTHNDLATSGYYEELLDRLDIHGWPYR